MSDCLGAYLDIQGRESLLHCGRRELMLVVDRGNGIFEVRDVCGADIDSYNQSVTSITTDIDLQEHGFVIVFNYLVLLL